MKGKKVVYYVLRIIVTRNKQAVKPKGGGVFGTQTSEPHRILKSDFALRQTTSNHRFNCVKQAVLIRKGS
jgi:hypothetical protein